MPTQSSASFKIENGVVDSGGGTASSASFRVTACVGSEIAGSASSASHRIDSGCGATALFVPAVGPGGGPGDTVPVPTLGDGALALLAMLLVVLAAKRIRPPAPARVRAGAVDPARRPGPSKRAF